MCNLAGKDCHSERTRLAAFQDSKPVPSHTVFGRHVRGKMRCQASDGDFQSLDTTHVYRVYPIKLTQDRTRPIIARISFLLRSCQYGGRHKIQKDWSVLFLCSPLLCQLCPVFVGGVAEEVDETIIYQHFSTFGAQCTHLNSASLISYWQQGISLKCSCRRQPQTPPCRPVG